MFLCGKRKQKLSKYCLSIQLSCRYFPLILYCCIIEIFQHWGVFIGFHDKKAYVAHTGTDFGDFGDNLISSSVESLATIRTKVSCRNQIQVILSNTL